MKALSIKQPWAHLIVHGFKGELKTIETRTWPTKYRGELLIVSSKKQPSGVCEWHGLDWSDMEFGKAIAVATLVDCRVMVRDDLQAALCPVYRGAFSWVLENVRPIEPFPVRGQLGLYKVDYEFDEVKA